MAKTRAEISAAVILNTGRSDKADLIDTLCDNALKVAVTEHAFEDSNHICDDLTITEDATSVSISSLEESSVSIGTLIDILTVRVVEADGTRNKILSMKNRQWWDRTVVNPEDNAKGWPEYGLLFGTNIILNRPAIDNLELRIRASAIPTFAADSTVCPIAIIDLFVEQYVTAMVFMSLEMETSYIFWHGLALGRDYHKGIVGGTLLAALNRDKSQSAEDKQVQRGTGGNAQSNNGVAVTNNTVGDPNFGNTTSWY